MSIGPTAAVILINLMAPMFYYGANLLIIARFQFLKARPTTTTTRRTTTILPTTTMATTTRARRTSTTTTVEPSTPSTAQSTATTKFVCPPSSGNYPNPLPCSNTFFICSNGTPYLFVSWFSLLTNITINFNWFDFIFLILFAELPCWDTL